MGRIVLLCLMCAGILAAGSRGATAPEAAQPSGPGAVPVAKGKRTSHPFRFLRRLGAAESELAIRLSSLGIKREADVDRSHALQLPSASAETSASKAPEHFGGASQ